MTRRVRGEGGTPRWDAAKGRWRANYTASDGRRRTVYCSTPGGKGKIECAKKRDEAIAADRAGGPVLTTRDAVATYLDGWVATWVDDGAHDQRTVHNYRSQVERHIAPAIGRRPLAELRGADVKLLLNQLVTKGLSGTSQQLVFDTLNQALKRAVKDGLIRSNPCALVDRPRRDTKPVEVWTDAEVDALLTSVEGDRLEALWNVCLLLGLRRGEALGLRWSDIDWDANTVSVSGQLDRFTRSLTGRKGHGRAVRHVMPDRVRSLLWARQAAQKRERIKAGANWAGNELGLVFTTRRGAPLPANNVLDAWHLRVQRAGIRQLKLHGARHYAASMQYADGARDEEVARFLGHADASSVTRLYIHLGERADVEAADRVNRRFARREAAADG
jgi:integrase